MSKGSEPLLLTLVLLFFYFKVWLEFLVVLCLRLQSLICLCHLDLKLFDLSFKLRDRLGLIGDFLSLLSSCFFEGSNFLGLGSDFMRNNFHISLHNLQILLLDQQNILNLLILLNSKYNLVCLNLNNLSEEIFNFWMVYCLQSLNFKQVFLLKLKYL